MHRVSTASSQEKDSGFDELGGDDNDGIDLEFLALPQGMVWVAAVPVPGLQIGDVVRPCEGMKTFTQ